MGLYRRYKKRDLWDRAVKPTTMTDSRQSLYVDNSGLDSSLSMSTLQQMMREIMVQTPPRGDWTLVQRPAEEPVRTVFDQIAKLRSDLTLAQKTSPHDLRSQALRHLDYVEACLSKISLEVLGTLEGVTQRISLIQNQTPTDVSRPDSQETTPDAP